MAQKELNLKNFKIPKINKAKEKDKDNQVDKEKDNNKEKDESGQKELNKDDSGQKENNEQEKEKNSDFSIAHLINEQQIPPQLGQTTQIVNYPTHGDASV